MFKEYLIDKITVESINIKSFYLKSKNGEALPDFRAGQFVNLKMRIPNIDKEIVRSYTLSGTPKKEYLRLTIKKENRGKVSSYLHDLATIGDTLLLSKPAGNFYVSNLNNNPVVLISAGVGITPMLSMLEYISENESDRKVHFIHSSRNKEVQPMLQRLLQLKANKINFQLSIFHSAPLAGELVNMDYDYCGYITKNHIPIDKSAEYFVCGPTSFMKSMFDYLNELEIKESKIHFEFFGAEKKFGTKKIYVDSKIASFDVNLTKSNKLILWKEGMGSLLELIESVGLAPDNSCRMGTCSTCESKLIKGTYEYDPEPFMETAEGNILICCAKPTSDIEIEL